MKSNFMTDNNSIKPLNTPKHCQPFHPPAFLQTSLCSGILIGKRRFSVQVVSVHVFGFHRTRKP